MSAKRTILGKAEYRISFLLLWLLLCTLGLTNVARAAPAFQAAGTAVSGTGSVSPAWPTHAVGDVAFLFVESAGGEPATLSTAAGFVAVSNSPQATGTTTNGTQITVFWARATSTTMATPTVADPGNHVYAQILTYRGVIDSGNPWDVTGGGVKAAASTTVTVTGVTTSVPDTLIVQAVARDDDASGAEFSSQANANLTGIAERTDAGTTSGNGGGFAVWDGVKATAGATGSTTANVLSSINAFLTIALKRVAPTVVSINTASTTPTEPATAVAWTVIFSASVTGVDASDFSLVQAGGVTGATITSVTGSGTTWTVNANTGSGTGTLGLNLVDDDSIINAVGTPLGDTGAGNGNFTGQVYTVSPPFCSPPSNIPAGVTVSCVCDTFGRASLNPSTIFGGNWTLSHGTTDSAGTNPYINATTGLLRLTENTNNNAKAATVPSIFPAAGNYISVEFSHYAYQGGNPGADGIAVTLSDYTIPAVPGGFGGSLGYAQRTDSTPNPPGFAGGWVGIALDEYGNFQNPTEGRVNGPGRIIQSVGVRGPGSGTSGYRYMGGTASNPGGFGISANSTSATPAPGYMYQVVVDSRGSGTGTINVSVNRDVTTKNGSTYVSLFGPFNAYTEANYALSQNWITQVVPDYWKISFTGSTGGSINVHEIGSLRICAQTVLPAAGGTASGFSAIDEAYTGSPAPAYSNFQTGDICMKLAGTPFKLWVAALTSTAISTGYSATSNKYVQVKLVDNADNACGTNAARTCNSTCTGKAGVETGATQIATFASGSSTGVAAPSPTFTLNSAYKNLIAVMKECTTSACTAFTATAPACSVDAFSVRPLSIASVTSSNATNSTTTGTTIFKAGSDNFSLTATTTGIAGSPSGYSGVLKLNNQVLQPASPATVAGAVAGTFPAATPATPSSTATGSTFTYSEVGGFKLPGYTPDATCTVNGTALTVTQCNQTSRSVYDGVAVVDECTTTAQCDALKAATWTGVDSVSTTGDCVANSYANVKDAAGKYGCNFGLLSNAVIFGRFVPDHFDTVVSGGMACPVGLTCPCPTGFTCPPDPSNGFIYSGQPFIVQVTALNAAGAVTKNYDSAMTLSKVVTLSAWDALGGSTANPGGGAMTAYTIPFTAFSAGVATTSTPIYTFSTTPTVPTDIYLRAEDTDGIRSLRATPSASVEGGIKVVSGRIKIPSAYGSELLPLPMTATVQFYNAAGSWVSSSSDTVTTIAAANFALAFPVATANKLAACETALSVTGSSPSFKLNLSAPGSGNNGWADLTLNLGVTAVGNRCTVVGGAGSASTTANRPWLQSPAGTNPAARATFGVYKGNNDFIYQRENY